MVTRKLVSILFILNCFVLPAQKKCGHSDYMNRSLSVNQQYKNNLIEIEKQTQEYKIEKNAQRKTAVTLPVVFHIVYNTPSQNLSDAQINQQLKVLNEDFRKLNSGAALVPQAWQGLAADCEINFCLAKRDPSNVSTSGITRRSTNVTQFGADDNVKRSTNGGTDPWNTQNYINIWVCNLGSGFYGYTPLPGGNALTDGVVLDYRVVGKPGLIQGADSGHTATHEMGHYFNLRHIWADDAGCDSSDFVNDTPNQAGSTLGCPTFPKTDACTATAPGVMFMNFMDYSDDDCLRLFTNGQKLRVQALLDPLTGWRRSLLSSLGCSEIVGISETPSQEKIKLFYTKENGAYEFKNIPSTTVLYCYDLLGRAVLFDYQEKEQRLSILNSEKGIFLLTIKNNLGEIIFSAKLLK